MTNPVSPTAHLAVKLARAVLTNDEGYRRDVAGIRSLESALCGKGARAEDTRARLRSREATATGMARLMVAQALALGWKPPDGAAGG